MVAAAAAAGSSRTGGAAGGDRDGAAGGQRRSLFRRRKVCKFCADKIDDINYKDVKLLQGFVPERAKVLPRRISGTCAKHQRKLRVAIMRARVLALLPYRLTRQLVTTETRRHGDAQRLLRATVLRIRRARSLRASLCLCVSVVDERHRATRTSWKSF